MDVTDAAGIAGVTANLVIMAIWSTIAVWVLQKHKQAVRLRNIALAALKRAEEIRSDPPS